MKFGKHSLLRYSFLFSLASSYWILKWLTKKVCILRVWNNMYFNVKIIGLENLSFEKEIILLNDNTFDPRSAFIQSFKLNK